MYRDSAELSHSSKVSGRRRNMTKSAQIVRNRCVSVCGYRAGYVGLDLAQLEAQIRFEIEDCRPDPDRFSGPCQLGRGEDLHRDSAELSLGTELSVPGRSPAMFKFPSESVTAAADTNTRCTSKTWMCLKRVLFFFLPSSLGGSRAEGPDCHFPKEVVGFGPIPARIRGFLIFIP